MGSVLIVGRIESRKISNITNNYMTLSFISKLLSNTL
jgi:hypothetical protein